MMRMKKLSQPDSVAFAVGGWRAPARRRVSACLNAGRFSSETAPAADRPEDVTAARSSACASHGACTHCLLAHTTATGRGRALGGLGRSPGHGIHARSSAQGTSTRDRPSHHFLCSFHRSTHEITTLITARMLAAGLPVCGQQNQHGVVQKSKPTRCSTADEATSLLLLLGSEASARRVTAGGPHLTSIV